MSSVDFVVRHYAASAALARDGVEGIVVGDPDGDRFNATAWELLRVSREEPSLWEDLLPPVKALRSRLLTQPRTATGTPATAEAAEEIVKQARLLRRVVASAQLLDRLENATQVVREANSPLADALLDLLQEGTAAEWVVVAASRKAQATLASWLGGWGIRVLTAGELGDEEAQVGRACVVGPPRFFRSSLVTAPAAERMCFLVPSWFRDLSIPRSPFASYAEGAIEVKAQIHSVGAARDTSVAEPAMTEAGPEEDLLPPSMLPAQQQTTWFAVPRDARKPARHEAAAHKLSLSGDLAMWLDDGERIRVLDPSRPTGDRATSMAVQEVRPGTVLLLRKGQSELVPICRASLPGRSTSCWGNSGWARYPSR